MPAAVCVAARGAKQSGRTGWSASDGGRGRCAGGTSVYSHKISRDRSGKWLRELDRQFLATSDPLIVITRSPSFGLMTDVSCTKL